MPIKILVVDDHPLIAEGIKNTLENYAEFTVLATLSNGKDAIDFVESRLVDIVLLDINMPEIDGIECAKRILKDFTNVKVVMLSMHQEMAIIKELISIGVKGYMLKTIPAAELQKAILEIQKGNTYFNEEITNALAIGKTTTTIPYVKRSKVVDELTTREIEIIKLLAEGLTNSQIGEQLFISPRTVDSHRTNIMKKLDLNKVASLIRFAFKNGIIS